MTIIGQFQGTLDIPMFVAPYSVTTPSYVSTVNQGNLNPRSDNPLMGEIFGYATAMSGYAGLNIPTSGYAVGLNYSGSNVFTIAGGYNASTASLTTQTPAASYLQNKLTFGYAWIGPTGFNSYAEIAFAPFFRDTNVATLRPGFDTKNGLPTATALPGSQIKYGNAFTALPCALSGIFEFSNPIMAYVVLLGNNSQLAIIAPGVDGALDPIDPNTGFPPVTGASIIDMQNAFNLFAINGAIPQNYLWGTNQAGPKITCIQWRSALAGAHSVFAVESIDTFQFDNPALNAVIANHSAGTTCFPCGLRGWLFSDIDHQADYFVSPDGTRYWKLNYVSQGNAKQVPSGQQATSKFVDFNGVFWYTGTQTQNGHTITPQYSFGYSIPFNRFTLPIVPPMSLPCYDDCLGQGVNITRRL